MIPYQILFNPRPILIALTKCDGYSDMDEINVLNLEYFNLIFFNIKDYQYCTKTYEYEPVNRLVSILYL